MFSILSIKLFSPLKNVIMRVGCNWDVHVDEGRRENMAREDARTDYRLMLHNLIDYGAITREALHVQSAR